MENIVWHYAPWAYLPEIVDSGLLRRSNSGAPRTLSMLWFSANQVWEPTAAKRVSMVEGEPGRLLNFREQSDAIGCVRFGLLADDGRVMGWRLAADVAGFSPKERRALEAVGRQRGANPEHWCASASDVSLDELYFQVWFENEWCDTTGPADMAAKWTQARGETLRSEPTAA